MSPGCHPRGQTQGNLPTGAPPPWWQFPPLALRSIPHDLTSGNTQGGDRRHLPSLQDEAAARGLWDGSFSRFPPAWGQRPRQGQPCSSPCCRRRAIAVPSCLTSSERLWSDGSPGPRCVTPNRFSCRTLGSGPSGSLENRDSSSASAPLEASAGTLPREGELRHREINGCVGIFPPRAQCWAALALKQKCAASAGNICVGWGRAARRDSPAPSDVAPTAGGAQPDPARGGGGSLQWSLSGEGGDPRVGCSGLVSVLPLRQAPAGSCFL